jgi:hypothetical protein
VRPWTGANPFLVVLVAVLAAASASFGWSGLAVILYAIGFAIVSDGVVDHTAIEHFGPQAGDRGGPPLAPFRHPSSPMRSCLIPVLTRSTDGAECAREPRPRHRRRRLRRRDPAPWPLWPGPPASVAANAVLGVAAVVLGRAFVRWAVV